MKECVDHKGVKYKTLRAMCSHWGINLSTFHNKLKKGIPLADILEPNPTPVTDHLGHSFPHIYSMCRHWGVTYSDFYRRRSQGWPLKCPLQNRANAHKCTDHTGQGFPSVPAMCEQYGVNEKTFRSRLATGMTLKQALTGSSFSDHKGNNFNTKRHMCHHYQISVKTYDDRIKNGWSVQQALETPDSVFNSSKLQSCKECTDHKGKKFKSKKEMCDHWGISDIILAKRLSRGWSLEKALTTSTKGHGVKDHTGRTFSSNSAMCNYWGVSVGTYKRRRLAGYSMKDSLSKDFMGRNAHTDHTGMKFPTLQAMCDHWHINRAAYISRIKYGYTVEKALTTPLVKHNKRCTTDHLGIKYPSVKAMCDHYGVPIHIYRKRRYIKKLDMEQALAPLACDKHSKRAHGPCKDHEEHVFKSQADMCRHWNIKPVTYIYRRKKGYSIKDALTLGSIYHQPASYISPDSEPCSDHLGNQFKSVQEMCRHWGVDAKTYSIRRRYGLPVGASLTGAFSKNNQKG